ncbi:MAG: MATE family efflux transporter [Bacteroidales bacterium]|nr:MATE family efflux transporter [Bacteroidales bacterium]
MNQKILRLAIPSIISNITVPLLGIVDMAIVGHLGDKRYIGAIAIGSMIFNIIYWNFGFLRMGTSGFTAQAYGQRDFDEVVRILVRSVAVGFFIALLLLILQYPLARTVFYFLKAGEEVERNASIYFFIGIWGAPAVLGLYGFKGWFIGMQNSRFPMYIAIVINCVNILCSLFFVYVLHMKVEGVALGTLIAQYFGLFMSVTLWIIYYGRFRTRIHVRESLRLDRMKRFFVVNRDIFFRTLCLVAVTSFFTSTGAAMGDTVLAVNTLLMQLFTLFSYIMDGFAFAGEALTGRYVGANNLPFLKRTVRLIFRWGFGLSVFFTLLYFLWGDQFLRFLTNDKEVLALSATYFYWVLAVPFAGFAAFLWDGIFVGATASKEMRSAMFIATSIFFVCYFLIHSYWGNHALWLAFLLYLSLRGIMLTIWAKKAIYGSCN